MLFASDLHFGKMATESVDAFLKAASEDPDKLVIIAGDLTQDSLPEEFVLCGSFFDRLKELGVTIVTTVGNHDFSSKVHQKFHLVTGGYAAARQNVTEILTKIYKQKEVIASNLDNFDSVTRIGNDVFVALCSQHRKGPRIKEKQVTWVVKVLEQIEREHEKHREQYDKQMKCDSLEMKTDADGEEVLTPVVWEPRYHFITHHSLWEDNGLDKHDAMRRRERLEENVLKRFKFFSYVHGHNHRFTYQNTSTPKTLYRIRRISLPTLSTRNKRWECGYVSWPRSEIESAEPTLCHLNDGVLVDS